MTTLREIAIEVAAQSGLTLEQIKERSNSRAIARPRHKAMHRQRMELGYSFTRIAAFWGSHSSTVKYAFRTGEKRRFAAEALSRGELPDLNFTAHNGGNHER